MRDPLRATLDRLGLGDFYDLLAANDVDASGIDELTEADLRELGLTLGQRKRFLRARAAPSGLAPPGQRPSAAHGPPPVGERRQLTSAIWSRPRRCRFGSIPRISARSSAFSRIPA